MSTNGKRTLLIVFLPQEWRVYARRPHWQAMAEHADLLLIESPAGILTIFFRPRKLLDYFRNRARVRTSDGHIYFFRPIQLAPPLLDFLFPVLAPFDRIIMRYQLKKALKQLQEKFDQAIIFITKVHQHHFSKIDNQHRQCFEITDLYLLPHGHQSLNEKLIYTKRAKKYEEEIIADSNLVLTTSRLIYEKLKSHVHNLYYFQNAVDYEHFSKGSSRNLPAPSDIVSLKSPKFGFVGYMNHLIDYELICKLHEIFPDSSIIMIGGLQKITNVHKDYWYQKSRKLANVFYLGYREYEDLPAYLEEFDVCLLPFRLNDWMRHSAPNKVYQYLAAGKPVVSTAFTEIANVKNVVYVAQDHAEFVSLVKTALTENSDLKKSDRQKVALENSTKNRAVKVMKILDNLLKQSC